MTFPGADTIKAGIIGLDFLRFIFRHWFAPVMLLPLLMPLIPVSLMSLPSVLGLSGSVSPWKPL
jgi:hypothetical protein